MATSSSYEPKEGSLSFFKVIRYPSSPHLALPKVVVEKHLDEIPKNPILTTATGEHSWKLKIIQIGEDYYFSNGWDKLVKDAHLSIEDIVVFWLIDSSTFLVSFLNENGCVKYPPIDNTNDGDYCNNGDNDGGGNVRNDQDEDDLVFQKKIPESKYNVILPKKFVKAAGLEKSTSIMIRDVEGHLWLIAISIERHEHTRHNLTSGWSLFRKHQNISAGDICLFKFNKKEGVLYLTQVTKSKKPFQKENSTEKRGRFGSRDANECSPIEKRDGFLKVKTEYVPGPQVPLKRSFNDVGGLKVKVEDEAFPEVVVAKRTKVWSPLEKPVEVKVEPRTERLVRDMGVVYF